MKIKIEEILEINRRRREINLLNISDIEFTFEGNTIKVDQKDLDDWRFIGLSNIDFVDFMMIGKYIPEQK